MDLLIVLLRIMHIVASVLWVGAAALLYVDGTRNALGSEDGIDVPTYFAVTSTVSVVGGAILYWLDSGGLAAAWISSPRGVAFGLGGLAAAAVWVIGNLLIPRIIGQRMTVSREARAGGSPADAGMVDRLHAIQRQLRTMSQLEVALLVFAVVAMAVAPELSA